jgi:endonuclease-3 related protein
VAAPVVLDAERLSGVYRRLLGTFGPQGWWPAQSSFEVMVGAILVQNTAWTNVEQAILRLKEHNLLDPQRIAAAPAADLAAAIRPAGYLNLKAARLQSFCRAYLAAGGLAELTSWDSGRLRAWLLTIKGVGPETADVILLYVFERPVFVVDAYARRVFSRLGWIGGDEGYEPLRQAVEARMPPRAQVYNEYHALLVELGKRHCRAEPRCGGCPLQAQCAAAVV